MCADYLQIHQAHEESGGFCGGQAQVPQQVYEFSRNLVTNAGRHGFLQSEVLFGVVGLPGSILLVRGVIYRGSRVRPGRT